jgi:hypothetical protein
VAAMVFDLLATGWLVPWTALITGLAMWQPFITDYEHRFQTSHGLYLWWFQHQPVVGALHLGWSILVVLVVLALPTRWLGLGTSSDSDPQHLDVETPAPQND